jgi:hypothetical protein
MVMRHQGGLANKTKSLLVKLVREAVEARGLGGCSSLHGLLKFSKDER